MGGKASQLEKSQIETRNAKKKKKLRVAEKEVPASRNSEEPRPEAHEMGPPQWKKFGKRGDRCEQKFKKRRGEKRGGAELGGKKTKKVRDLSHFQGTSSGVAPDLQGRGM